MKIDKQQARKPLLKLYLKYFGLGFVPLLALNLSIFLILFFTSVKTRRDFLRADQRYLVDLKKREILNRLDMIAGDVLLLAGQNEMGEVVWNQHNRFYEEVARKYRLFSKMKKIYTDCRYYDIYGDEKIRAEYSSNEVTITVDPPVIDADVPFKDIFYLERGQVGIYTLRATNKDASLIFGAPAFDERYNKTGAVVVVYSGENFSQMIMSEVLSNRMSGQFLLVDPYGNCLVSSCIDSTNKIPAFIDHYPREWARISRADQGQFFSSYGLFTFDTIAYQEDIGHIKSASGKWILLSFVSSSIISREISREQNLYLWMGILILGLTGLTAFLVKRMLSERKIMLGELGHAGALDPVTEVFNRTTFLEMFQKELSKAQRYDRQFTVIMVDINRFHKIRGRYGKRVSNFLLRRIGELLKNNLRQADILCRWNVDEFLILLPETPLENAYIVTKKIEDIINNVSFMYMGKKLEVTVSFEVAVFPGEELNE